MTVTGRTKSTETVAQVTTTIVLLKNEPLTDSSPNASLIAQKLNVSVQTNLR